MAITLGLEMSLYLEIACLEILSQIILDSKDRIWILCIMFFHKINLMDSSTVVAAIPLIMGSSTQVRKIFISSKIIYTEIPHVF
jgi:hypothetical protein